MKNPGSLACLAVALLVPALAVAEKVKRPLPPERTDEGLPVVDRPVVQGGIEADDAELNVDLLLKAVTMRRKGVQACYAAGLRKDPTLAGRLAMEVVIDPRGRTSKLRVTSHSFVDQELVGCLRRLVASWTYPLHPPSDAPFTLTLILSPPAEAPATR
jgi:hypothetical protein